MQRVGRRVFRLLQLDLEPRDLARQLLALLRRALDVALEHVGHPLAAVQLLGQRRQLRLGRVQLGDDRGVARLELGQGVRLQGQIDREERHCLR
eukprot:SAG22_NODE_2856_length_2153_cov_1.616845_1_plen_94_part_00